MGSPCLHFSGVVPRQIDFDWESLSINSIPIKKALIRGVGVALTIRYLSVSRLK